MKDPCNMQNKIKTTARCLSSLQKLYSKEVITTFFKRKYFVDQEQKKLYIMSNRKKENSIEYVN